MIENIIEFLEPIVLVKPEDPIAHIRKILLRTHGDRVIVFKEKPLGIITEKDLVEALRNEKRPIDEITAKEIMKKQLITITPDTPIKEAAKIMLEKGISGIPVEKEKDLIGMVTKRSLLKYFSRTADPGIKVEELMTKGVKTVKEFHSIFHAIKEMKKHKIGRLVVVRDNKPVGIITEHDLSLASFKPEPSKIIFIRKSTKGPISKQVRILPIVVADVMQENIKTVKPEESAVKAAEKLLKHKIGSLIVVDKKGSPSGIITKTDFIKKIVRGL